MHKSQLASWRVIRKASLESILASGVCLVSKAAGGITLWFFCLELLLHLVVFCWLVIILSFLFIIIVSFQGLLC